LRRLNVSSGSQAVFATLSGFGWEAEIAKTLRLELGFGAKSNPGEAVWASVSMLALADFRPRFRMLSWVRGTQTSTPVA